ncbi:MAG: hypothetical protein B6D46_07380 [Polyangiaceae bacterium UTPRO1]|jgi:hypothetical protein|nr:PIN domain-containing protein [Myxococcales bacterium]OQY67299.1 MAG: hypothetical protein B6D46_07380 [Polyangiaceae bacterium UTPRO1]
MTPFFSTCPVTGDWHFYSDNYVGRLQDLKALGEYRLEYDGWTFLSPEGWKKLVTKPCDCHGAPMDITRRSYERLLAHYEKFGADPAPFFQHKRICERTYTDLYLKRCDRCSRPYPNAQESTDLYTHNDTIRAWRRGTDQEFQTVYKHLCSQCHNECLAEAQQWAEEDRLCRERAAERLRTFAFVTPTSSFPGYDVVKRFGQVRSDSEDATGTPELEERLRKAAADAGGNALIYFTYKRNERSERYVAGTGPRGNPYYRTRRLVWYTGTGEAVLAVSTGDDRKTGLLLTIVADTNAWIHYGTGLIDNASPVIRFVVPSDVYREIDGLKNNTDELVAQRAREAMRSWEANARQVEVSDAKLASAATTVLRDGSDGSLKRDIGILECATAHAMKGQNVFLLSSDNGLLLLAAKIKDEHPTATFAFGRPRDLINVVSQVVDPDTARRWRRRGA